MAVAKHRGWFPNLIFGVCILTALTAPCRGESAAVSEWKKQMAVRLGQHNRVPPEACRQGGEAALALRVDRDGRLISAEITKNSGVPLLDETALAIARGAQPFPRPPAEFADSNARFEAVLVFVRSTDPGKQGEIIRQDELLQKRLHSICRGC